MIESAHVEERYTIRGPWIALTRVEIELSMNEVEVKWTGRLVDHALSMARFGWKVKHWWTLVTLVHSG